MFYYYSADLASYLPCQTPRINLPDMEMITTGGGCNVEVSPGSCVSPARGYDTRVRIGIER